MWVFIPLLLREGLYTCDIPSACVLPCLGLGSNHISAPLPFFMWPSPYVFSYGRSVVSVFRFSEEVALYVVVALMCPWEVTQDPLILPSSPGLTIEIFNLHKHRLPPK